MGDLEFVQKCVKGDKQALNEFIDRYSRLIYKYIHSVLEIKGASQFTQDNTNDLFQEIFLCLVKDNFRKLKSFKAKNGCSLASWLRQVVINYSIDYTRKFKTVVSLDAEINGEITLKDMLKNEHPSFSDMLGSEEKLIHLKECIRRLDTDDKYLLELHFNRGLSLEELRDIFKLSRGAMDMRKSRVVGLLRECFKDKGFKL